MTPADRDQMKWMEREIKRLAREADRRYVRLAEVDAGAAVDVHAVALLESVSAATGTAAARTPATGASPIYTGDYGAAHTYDANNTIDWQWFGGAVPVTSGKARMGMVVGGLLIPLCEEVALS